MKDEDWAMPIVRWFATMAVLPGMLAGCQALTGQTLGRNIDDTTLTTTVKTQLAKDKLASLTRVGVGHLQLRCDVKRSGHIPAGKGTRGRDRTKREWGEESQQ
jgi:hypothetical protein